MSAVTPEPRGLAVRPMISDAYYEARNHRRTMDQAADDAAAAVMAHLSALAADPDVIEACAIAHYARDIEADDARARVLFPFLGAVTAQGYRDDAEAVLGAFLHAAGGQP